MWAWRRTWCCVCPARRELRGEEARGEDDGACVVVVAEDEDPVQVEAGEVATATQHRGHLARASMSTNRWGVLPFGGAPTRCLRLVA